MKFLLGLIVLITASSAMSQSKIVSVDAFDLAYSGGLVFKHDDAKNSNLNSTTFKLNLNYAQSIEQYVGLMWKARVHINRQDIDYGKYDAFSSTYGAAGGVLYNFNNDDIKNSFMAGALAGIERATYGYGSQNDKSGFNLFLDFEAGKRWDLGQYSVANISYAPTISVNLKRYGGGIRDEYFRSGNELKFNFLKFDILF